MIVEIYSCEPIQEQRASLSIAKRLTYNVPVIVMNSIHDVNKKVDLFSLDADEYLS